VICVDELRDLGWVLYGKRIQSCHMAADTLEELHAFAYRMGLKRKWFQDKSIPHYDLTEKMRNRAIQMGVKELRCSGFVLRFKKERKNNA
jgi:hypothetical protein